MKVITNSKNPAVFKLLIAAKLAGKTVQVENISVEEKGQRSLLSLPALIIDSSGAALFSANQASRFLLPPKKSGDVQTDHWLEWDASQLQPGVAACISAPGKQDDWLKSLLQSLDKALQNKEVLVENAVSVADVCVWVTLYPVAADKKLNSSWLSAFPNVTNWWNKLQTNATFQSVVKENSVHVGVEGVQTTASATWYPVNSYSSSSTTQKKRVVQSQVSLESGMSSLSLSGGAAQEGPAWEAEVKNAQEKWDQKDEAKPKTISHPVLPKKNEKNILITSALPYVNNVPHLGNIIGCVLSADIFSRYCQLRNYNTLLICGTDEYGTATETKALEEGLTPQQICDKYFAIHRDIYKWFNIKFHHFGRTTDKNQTEVTQKMFLRLNEQGFMLTESMEQLLCEKCDRFLADRFVEGTCPKCKYEDARGDQCDGCGNLVNATELIKPRCKVCGNTPVVRNSDQFFMDLPKLEPKLQKWIEERSEGWSHNARVITNAWLKEGLKPRCITRDLKWGIPVPLDGFRNKVFYVWFDAPIGYMSMTKTYTDKWLQWWQPDKDVNVELYQFMAKDNVPFHSIMFPATLLGADQGYVTVSHIMATEYLNYEDGKFSKSRGLGVFGNDAQDTGIPADVWRFYLAYMRPESQDSSFCWDDLVTKVNSELLSNLGNFVNRALVFVERQFGGVVPEMSLDKDDLTLLALVTREVVAYVNTLEKGRLRDGIRYILNISRHGNQYMQSQQPWVLAKGTEEERRRAGTIVGLGANISCLLSVLLSPYMPETARIMQEQLQAPASVNIIVPYVRKLLPAGHRIGKPAPLFKKIEAPEAEALKKRFAGKQQSPPPSGKPAANTALSSGDANQLEQEIQKQGELVRSLKSKGTAKSELQPHINKLLQLKEQLKNLASAATSTQPTPASPADVNQLEEEIKKQGDLVRSLKSQGTAKSELQPHINKLLQLKEQLKNLAAAAPAPPKPTSNEPAPPSPAQINQLEEEIKKQGELVRSLKSKETAKSELQPHINKLLQLKEQLNALVPGSAAPPPSGEKSKKKKKK